MPRIGVALLIAAAVLVGCGDEAPDDYDADVEREFLEECTTASPAQLCQCLYDRIEAEIPFARFEQVDRELAADPGDPPDDIARLAVICATENAAE
jgi:hypothetical protein